jgi:glyoxylase-like metal-dependent hydrolase (beta-lactamase superfamily II)
MKHALYVLLTLGCLFATRAQAQLAPGSMDVHWNPGAADCTAHPPPPLQVHRYNAQTYILRENLCTTGEAPFMYLLIGDAKALLIDTGDVTDANKVPLASTVLALLPQVGTARMPLIVVHTHGHLDHRSGDAQLVAAPDVQIVGTDLPHVTQYFGFPHWPEGTAQVDLGERTVDVVPTPGHYPSHVSYYDRATGLLFTGDFFLPGRLIIEDADADRASARRIVAFVATRPVSHILGGHVELDQQGNLEPLQATFRPNERSLPLDKDDLLKLPATLAGYNGIYGRSGMFVMYSQTRMLQLAGATALLLLIIMILAIRWAIRRRRRCRAASA